MLEKERIAVLLMTIALVSPVLGVGAAERGGDDAYPSDASPVTNNDTIDHRANASRVDASGARTVQASAPPGLGVEDPWVDANGDEMFGSLDMGPHGLFLNDRLLSATTSGDLQFDGQSICLDTTGCSGSTLQGDLPIEVASSVVSLSTNGCNAGELWKWTGSSWDCQPDTDTDTTYSAGDGLVLSGSTFEVDGTTVQLRVDGSCASGEAIRAIASDGTVTCEVDDDTTYDGSDFALSDQACPSGEYVDSIDGSGAVVCAVDQDSDTTYSAGTGLALSGTTFSADTSVVQARVSGACPDSAAVQAVNADGSVACQPLWGLTGNQGTTPGTDFIGTTDDAQLDLRVNGVLALRLEPTDGTPNVVGGNASNTGVVGIQGATVSGGGTGISPNTASDDHTTVGGGDGNEAGDGDPSTFSGTGATVAGGISNVAFGSRSVVAGGYDNNASGSAAAIGGGVSNEAPGGRATIGGGYGNVAEGSYSFVGAGYDNNASGFRAGVVAGASNEATGSASVVAGGYTNEADGRYSFVGSGYNNSASGLYSTIGGGLSNVASYYYATVAGGYDNEAAGRATFAAGAHAKALHHGSFVWSDDDPYDFESTRYDQFRARATGGVQFVSAIDSNGDPTAGVTLAPGSGSWSSLSDRAAKENLQALDGRAVLDDLADVPVYEWNYIAQDDGVRHVGPTAQDFHAAFGVGEDDTRISNVDADGVALAAIQGLNEKVDDQAALIAEQERTIERQEQTLDAQRQVLEQMQERLSALEEAQGLDADASADPGEADAVGLINIVETAFGWVPSFR